MTAPTHWWWVRHAPVPGAAAGRIYGQSDVACDTSDAASFRALAAILPVDAVWVTSPLRRTEQTRAAIVAAGLAGPAPIVETGLTEQNFGHWQNLTWDAMAADDPEAYERFWRDPLRLAPPGGESYADQLARVAAAIDRVTTAHAGRHIISISHGGTIRAAVAQALALPPECAMAIAVDNLSVTRLTAVGEPMLHGRGAAWRVEAVNAPCRWLR